MSNVDVIRIFIPDDSFEDLNGSPIPPEVYRKQREEKIKKYGKVQ